MTLSNKLAVLILAVINVVFSVECPKDQGDWTELVIKHEECGKFYKCTPNGPIVMFCPEGLYFNPETYHCDWKENVDCSEENSFEDKEIQSEEESDSESKEVDNSEMEDLEGGESNESEIKFLENGCPVNPHIHWLLPDENDCSIFYYCVHGEKIRKSCPSHLHFNRNSQDQHTITTWINGLFPQDSSSIELIKIRQILDDQMLFTRQVCDWPDVAGCAKSSEDNDSEVNASEVDSSEDNNSEVDNSEENISEKVTSEEDTSDITEVDTTEVDTSEDDSQIDSQLFKKIETDVNVKLLHLIQ